MIRVAAGITVGIGLVTVIATALVVYQGGPKPLVLLIPTTLFVTLLVVAWLRERDL